MNDYKDLPKNLPDNNFTIILEPTEGAASRKSYHGEFTFMIPNIRIFSNIAKTYAVLNAGLEEHLPMNVIQLHDTLAFLEHTLIKSPQWWKDCACGKDIQDANILGVLRKKTEACEKEYELKIWGKPEEESKNEK